MDDDVLKPEEIVLFDDLANQSDTDIFIFNGPMDRESDRKVIQLCCKRNRRKKVLLILVTEGGDADAAYRISRCFQQCYGRFICYVSGYCKSAGTLLAIGANELIFSNYGELGPIDVQMSKKDELWEQQSGLTVTSALTALQEKAFNAFERWFLNTKYKGRGAITLRTAIETAAKLTTGLYGPLFQQIDPMHVGEAGRAISIAKQYGERLNLEGKNLKPESLETLISGYMTHGFVIDQREAKDLFNNVRGPSPEESKLEKILGDHSRVPRTEEPPLIGYLSSELSKQSTQPIQPEMMTNGQQITELSIPTQEN